MKTVDFSETIAASDLKGGRRKHLIEYMKIYGVENHATVIFFTFLGTVPIPVQLGKIAPFSLQLGKKHL